MTAVKMNVIRRNINFLACFFTALLLCGCSTTTCLIEPEITYIPQERQFKISPSAFAPLNKNEIKEDWAKELHIGSSFAKQLDLYRAITCFQRAKFLLPQRQLERQLQIDFALLKSYFLGRKYETVINIFEDGPLSSVSDNFPTWNELLIMLATAYYEEGECDVYEKSIEFLKDCDPQFAHNLRLGFSITSGDLPALCSLSTTHPNKEAIQSFLNCYYSQAKSPKKAQWLNALLPGAGYYYVGQKNTAITSFLMNTLFIAATYHFFHHGNWGAGLIALSFESGWYIGGINGAGLAAKQHNECLYNTIGKDLMIRHRLFPVLMLETSF